MAAPEAEPIPHDPGPEPPGHFTPLHGLTNALFVLAAVALEIADWNLIPELPPPGILAESTPQPRWVLTVLALFAIPFALAKLWVSPSKLRKKYAQWHADHEAWDAYQHQKQVTAWNRKAEIAQLQKRVIDAHDDLTITAQTPRVERTLDLNELQHAVDVLTKRGTIQGLQETLEDVAWDREHTRAWRRLDAYHLMRVVTGILEPPPLRVGLPPPPPAGSRSRSPQDLGEERATKAGNKAAEFAAARRKLQERRHEVLQALATGGHGPGTPAYDQTVDAFDMAAQQLRVEYGLDE